MPSDNNINLTTTYYGGQPLAFTQCDDFVSIMGLLVALLNKRSLKWSFTFHALWSLEHSVMSVSGSDKLD